MRFRHFPHLVLAACALAVTAAPVRAQTGAQDASAAPARGSPDPLVTIVEFSDFECPYCALAVPVIDSLMALHGDAIRVEYRHYPLPMHAHAKRAAQAAVEAQRQGEFWDYYELLFRNRERLADVDLVGYADSLGLDSQAFAAALADSRHARRVEEDVSLGYALAVTGTPTFFVNGYRITGVPPLWVFELALETFREGRVERRPLEPPRPSGEDGRNGR
ncbi:MAG: DsbA family protein [Gemmatimonadota bacterium]